MIHKTSSKVDFTTADSKALPDLDGGAIHRTGSHTGDQGALTRRSFLSVIIPGSILAGRVLTQQQPADLAERFKRMSEDAERKGLADPFKGITSNGQVEPGLFPVHSTGVSTEPVRVAAEKFLSSLTAEQRGRTMFAVDDPEWRKWMNQHFYVRQGVCMKDLTEVQRNAAFGLLSASLSARGVQL